MTPKKLHVHAAFFNYSGNGGYASMLPEIGFWWADTLLKCSNDQRISRMTRESLCDTPITMTRNKAVDNARKLGADFLLMVDSDNAPDIEPDGKPFWDTSFNKMYEHYEKGPLVVFAPYCGPPPHENPYVFEWRNYENDAPGGNMKLDGMSRERAAQFIGLVDVAAGPTGLILYDMRAFDLIDPPYFAYEWSDDTHSDKCSTEDVYNLRNISLNGISRLGYNPVLCNFDAWAGHAKQKMVRKPRCIGPHEVHATLKKAILDNHPSHEKMIIVGEDFQKEALSLVS